MLTDTVCSHGCLRPPAESWLDHNGLDRTREIGDTGSNGSATRYKTPLQNILRNLKLIIYEYSTLFTILWPYLQPFNIFITKGGQIRWF